MKPFFRQGKKDRISVEFPCHKKSLMKARKAVLRFALSKGFAEEAEDIALATQEALKNVIQHACPADNRMVFACEVDGDTMTVDVIDHGRGFDVGDVEGEPSSLLALHGRGFKIIRGLMDDVRVTSDRNGTVVHMEKSRSRH